MLASSIALLLLASNVHGGEHLQELLLGQILWVNPNRLPTQALICGVILAVWFGLGARLGRIGFYVLFACTVTASVQLVGLYLVFSTLVIPAVATYYNTHRRYLKAYLVGLIGYALGLAGSAATDLPSGAMIVCALAIAGGVVGWIGRRGRA